MFKHSTVIFIFLLLTNSHSKADALWDNHIVPTFKSGFDKTGLLIAGSGTGVTLLSQTYDDEMKNDWGKFQKLNESQADVGDKLGTGIPGGLIAVTQLLVDSNNGVAHIESLVWAFAATSALKYINNRPRPNGLNRHSMPSGHTSTAFATATSLSYAYGWKAAVPGYLLATYVALTRVSEDAHWLSDTIAGATVGLFWGRAATLHHTDGSTETTFLVPWVVPGGGGVRLVSLY